MKYRYSAKAGEKKPLRDYLTLSAAMFHFLEKFHLVQIYEPAEIAVPQL
jgi:hypothetical protein